MLAAVALATAASGCSSFIDVNNNPNAFTTDNAPTPDAILAQALNTTAGNYNGYTPSFNSYASFAADYWGRSGVIVGFAEERTYNYTTAYMQGLFGNTYDNLNDYNVIQTQSAAITTGSSYLNHAAIARIMKAYNFLLLVDEYGDIPYSQALKGSTNLTPTYDKAADIYQDLIVQLKGAITDINTAVGDPAKNIPAARAVGAEDIVFNGNMLRWKQFANSLQLRILLRESQTTNATLNAYVTKQMADLQSTANATDGFITIDVLSNPGYTTSSGQQNPFYARYGVTITGTSSAERLYQIPTNYVIRQYTDNADPRIAVLYTAGKKPGVTTIYNGVTYFGTDAGEQNPPLVSTANPVYASRFLLGTATVTAGILKGNSAPTALMLLSEHYFNKAEAETRGLFTGGETDAKADYNRGILASFLYFFRPATTAAVAVPATPTTSTIAGASQYVTYMASAVAGTTPNALVNYDAAATTPGLGKQYVILYQKYLAMNSVGSTEAWDDYRRAAQPKIESSLEAATAGKFPKRLLYPLTEVNTNQANIPKVDQYTPIFWDVID